MGVVFEGPAPLDGGGILNQGGNFGVNARSGTDFLAFNRNSLFSDGGTPRDPENLLFDSFVNEVSIWASGGNQSTSFMMEGFRNGQLIEVDTIQLVIGRNFRFHRRAVSTPLFCPRPAVTTLSFTMTYRLTGFRNLAV